MEVETQLLISKKITYLSDKDFDILSNELNEIIKMLQGLIKSIN